MMRFVLWFGAVVVLAGLAYVRLAPHDVAAVHQPIEESTDVDRMGEAVRVMEVPRDVLAAADAYMRALPRTKVLSGSVESGLISYVTRSRVFGFPDYTTLAYRDGQLRAYARLRFGRSDMGVNAARLDGLIAALQ